MQVLGVAGSLRRDSHNLKLLRAAAAQLPPGVLFTRYDRLRLIPGFNEDDEPAPSVEVAHWREAIAGSDAVLIATPEYGFSLPGALKNGIDWVIGSGELERKIVAITAAVPVVTTLLRRGKRDQPRRSWRRLLG